jgi:fumarate reductase (CoM/CoB) subunit A
MMEKDVDVIVVGAGCAGMIAAFEAGAGGAKVAIIDRGPIGIGSNSSLAGGGFASPTSRYRPEEYVKNTLSAGKGLNRESLVSLMAEQAPSGISFLRSLGVEFLELPHVYVVKSPRIDLNAGVTLVKVLARKVKNSRLIEVLNGFYVTEIIKDGENVCGVRGFMKTGEDAVIYAPAVVLATGGAGAIYLKNDNQKGIMGQGYYLAAKAGLALWDMEFVQFHPLVIAEPGLPSQPLFPPYPQETRMVNTSGEDILRKYNINSIYDAVQTSRDQFSAILYQENLTGSVFMDYRRIPVSLWGKQPISLLTKLRFDFRKNPFAVSPAAHFFMGGVRIEENGQTPLPGLFACGEVVWGLHGANRMGGNALTECLVFGRIAGRNAAQYALTHSAPVLNKRESSHGLSNAPSFNRERLVKLRRQIRELAWTYAGVVRSEISMKKGLVELVGLEMELKGIVPLRVRDRKLLKDLMSAVFLLKVVLTASLSRKESRGSFIREDFSHQDDVDWRKNSCVIYEPKNNQFSLSYHPCN